MKFNRFIFSAVGASFLVLMVFAVLQWLNFPTGHFLDWIVGVASFWWLLIIVTLPWNMYFNSREVIEEAKKSRKKKIRVDEKELEYVQKVARKSLVLAIVLHLLSTLGLYALAVFEISSVGYISSFAALLLTGLRPAIRAHEYIVYRLSAIRREFRYPREDVDELRTRVKNLETNVNRIDRELDPKLENSLISGVLRNLEVIGKELTTTRVSLENLTVTHLSEHEALTKEARQAIARITEDGPFLDNVREIIRFVKSS